MGVHVLIMSVMMAVPVVAPMFSADVMAMNPLTPVPGPVAGNPNHFIVAGPIAGTMAVVGPVADLDAEALRLDSGDRNKSTGRKHRGDQKFFLNHTSKS
jgi:hypothetical protein